MSPGYWRFRRWPEWPELSYGPWSATCDTLHAHTQVLGKLAVELARRSRSFSTPPCD